LRLFHAASIWARDSGHVSAAYLAICSTSAEVGDIIGWMAIDDPGLRERRSTLGYAMVLLGSVLFVASCFLPYFAVLSLSVRTLSLYQQLTLGPYGGFSEVGTWLYLFGGVAPVAAVSVVALVREERRPVLPYVLAGAVVAWSLTWIGSLLRLGTFDSVSLEIGFWLQAVSIGVAVIGTILVVTRRRGAHERAAAGI
jgi:hypothetical protein